MLDNRAVVISFQRHAARALLTHADIVTTPTAVDVKIIVINLDFRNSRRGKKRYLCRGRCDASKAYSTEKAPCAQVSFVTAVFATTARRPSASCPNPRRGYKKQRIAAPCENAAIVCPSCAAARRASAACMRAPTSSNVSPPAGAKCHGCDCQRAYVSG